MSAPSPRPDGDVPVSRGNAREGAPYRLPCLPGLLYTSRIFLLRSGGCLAMLSSHNPHHSFAPRQRITARKAVTGGRTPPPSFAAAPSETARAHNQIRPVVQAGRLLCKSTQAGRLHHGKQRFGRRFQGRLLTLSGSYP